MRVKGILLAGGSGTRLFPITKGVSKQLLPIYDKPMVYYPLSTLMGAGIQDILIITTPQDQENFKRLLGDGSCLGINLSYAVQAEPKGIAQAFTIAEECGFADKNTPLALILGDNIFHCAGFFELLRDCVLKTCGEFYDDEYATIFGYWVTDPERYGVAEIDNDGRCLSIEEKPVDPKSNYAVVGLYFYPRGVTEMVKCITPSGRGELEITALNQLYLDKGKLSLEVLPRGCAWFDCGLFDSMLDASNYVATVEKRQGLQIACLEEIAFNNEWIDEEQVLSCTEDMRKNSYGQYIFNIINNNTNQTF